MNSMGVMHMIMHTFIIDLYHITEIINDASGGTLQMMASQVVKLFGSFKILKNIPIKIAEFSSHFSPLLIFL